jgi:hypothetical protein
MDSSRLQTGGAQTQSEQLLTEWSNHPVVTAVVECVKRAQKFFAQYDRLDELRTLAKRSIVETGEIDGYVPAELLADKYVIFRVLEYF